ncbi:ATPase, T2SS/T4P/T4SS family [Desulfogranum mediterraneum]|uniref:ATPase, T2SS/T4P/T4SS family n=1 Tax=Desulfogranum mediterraneum TaxID=160661 RepID=UPI00048FCB45|nr:ATPase, T2SS/T4P/T4SS family [Desulfogranum mediterraneum]
MADYTSFFTGETSQGPEQGKESPAYRILIVDDEPHILDSMRRVFRKENYRIETASSAREALELMRRKEFQLIISDHMMPGMTGAELLQKVREVYPDTIRIMLTGHADTSAIIGAIKDGAVYRFILKPAQDDDLRVTVALALEQFDIIKKNKELLDINTRQSKEMEALSKLSMISKSQLPSMLQQHGCITDNQVQKLYQLQTREKNSMLQVILEKGWVSEKKIHRILKEELCLEEVALHEIQVDPRVTELIPRIFCMRHLVLPLKLRGKKKLLLAAADPTDFDMINNLRFITGLQIETVLADLTTLESKITAVYGEASTAVSFKDMETVATFVDPFDAIEIIIEEEEDVSLTELLRSTEEPPAIRLVNAILIEAVRNKVSDIHIQPKAKSVVVRYRSDGILTDKIHIPLEFHSSLVSRIKIMAELDIAERRKPQDGRITVKTPLKIVDMRISTLPTMNGEKVVMRLLDRNAAIHTVDELGFSKTNLEKVFNLIDVPQGIILATGPTGSGKTTTLYSLLQHNVSPEKNYITLEDPIEYYFDSASQVPIREKIGLSFASVLRSALRQDPDVILLGEIRDAETASVAFNAALTGHQVFSTLHTNSAVETVARLIDLELRPYIIASALKGIVSQRLVRKICPHCREEVKVSPRELSRLGPLFATPKLKTYQGKGCRHCHGNGFEGRLPIHELLIMSDLFVDQLSAGQSIVNLRKAAEQEKMPFLIEDARNKVHAGLTTVAEVHRVLGPQV